MNLITCGGVIGASPERRDGDPRFWTSSRRLLPNARGSWPSAGLVGRDRGAGATGQTLQNASREHLALCNHIDARALSPTGRIGLGDAAMIAMQHEEGYTLNELAMFNSVSVRLVEAIIQECERFAAI
jgi:hypothetical protein